MTSLLNSCISVFNRQKVVPSGYILHSLGQKLLGDRYNTHTVKNAYIWERSDWPVKISVVAPCGQMFIASYV
jgi:hypothetical protein